jgi:hypothetical protein
MRQPLHDRVPRCEADVAAAAVLVAIAITGWKHPRRVFRTIMIILIRFKKW